MRRIATTTTENSVIKRGRSPEEQTFPENISSVKLDSTQ